MNDNNSGYISSILDSIGSTPLVKLNRLMSHQHIELYAKCEMFNPSMSIKDRIVISMIQAAEEQGLLKPGGTIVEASSGNTGSSIAMIAAVLGYKAIITTPDKTSQEKIKTMQMFDAEVIVCSSKEPKTSTEHYVNKAKLIADETPDSVHLNQYENMANPQAHYETTATEIWSQLEGKVDYLVASASSGGTISGIGKYLKQHDPSIKVIMPDPVGSVYHHFYHYKNLDVKPEPYKVEGIGKDYICKTIDFDVIDDVVQVTDKQSFDTVKLLAQSEGILAGGSSGTALYAALMLAEQLASQSENKRIVVIFPDTGLKYFSKL